jgi:hypothetical protein
MNIKYIIISFIIINYFYSCKTAEFGFLVIDLNGMVYDFDNKPVQNYKITIGKKYSSVTDINGRFLISKIPAGHYSLKGEKNEYETYEGDILINDRRQIVYIRVPNYNQLLGLVDTALTDNHIENAEIYAQRANAVGGLKTELLFYLAIIKFRQKDNNGAIEFLRTAVNTGSSDIYINQFLNYLLKNGETE